MSLEILCDEHVEKHEMYPALSRRFRVAHVVDHVELGQGVPDEQIWRQADRMTYTLLTSDQDFLTGAANPEDGSHPGIIYYDETATVDACIKALNIIDSTTSSLHLGEHGIILHIPGAWTRQETSKVDEAE